MGFDRYFSGNIIEQIKEMGYEGPIPEDTGEQYILKNRLEEIKKQKYRVKDMNKSSEYDLDEKELIQLLLEI